MPNLRAGAGAVTVYIGLGSNLEDPRAQVNSGIRALSALPSTRLTAKSALYSSSPVGYADQPDFINAVAALETSLAPRSLLEALLAIERGHGRVRDFANAPRTLDLDLLLYAESVIQEPGLIVPHPRMHERAFVLLPLAEIAPDYAIPGHGAVRVLLAKADLKGVTRLGEPAI